MADHWCWNNLVDDVYTSLSVTVGGFSGDLGIDNVRDPRVGRPFRAALMPSEVRVALPAATPLSVFGIFGANLDAMGSVTLMVGTGPGIGDILTTSITPAGRQQVVLLRGADGQPAPTTAATHVTIATTGAIPFEMGRLWIGQVDWTPTVGHSPSGSLWQADDLSVRSQTPRGGAFLIDKGKRLRKFTASYQALYPSEYNGTLFDLDVEFGLSQQVLFIPNPDVYPIDRWPILGYLRELPENRFVGFQRGARDMTVVEAG
jgi:hypothetical protein